MADERFDGLFLSVTQQAKGIEPLLDNLFSFLRRKTDFFVGASNEQIEETVLSIIKKHSTISEREEAEKKKIREKELQKKKADVEKKVQEAKAKSATPAPAPSPGAVSYAAAATSAVKVGDDDVLEINEDGTFDASAAPSAPSAPAAAPHPPPRVVKDLPKLDEESAAKLAGAPLSEDEEATKASEEAEDKTPAPVGNGGTVEGKYSWTQTLADLQVNVPLPPGTKAKMMDVKYTNTKISVGIKGQPPIFAGDLHKRVIVDDSFWTVEDNDLVFTLQKDDKMNWWKCVVVGDPEINTQKVQPENSKLSDLDGETRQTVEKMMFDQRQKAAGLPSADELQKQEMLKKFMDQHPEMDFSKAKFN